MTGLPQMWNPQRRKLPEPDVPFEVKLWQQTHEDARRYQTVAYFNFHAFGNYPSTRIRATEQYAYVRWLMGIDDYWLSLERTIHPRPDFDRLPHQRLPVPDGVRTPGDGVATPDGHPERPGTSAPARPVL